MRNLDHYSGNRIEKKYEVDCCRVRPRLNTADTAPFKENTVRLLAHRAMGILLSLMSCIAYAAADGAGTGEVSEPTVSGFWVGVFVAVFVAICVWFVIAIWRAERRNKAK